MLSSIRFTRQMEKVILALILLICMVIANAYSGSLASFLAVPRWFSEHLLRNEPNLLLYFVFRYEPPIDTIAQLASSGIRWGATSIVWVYAISGAQDVSVFKISFHFSSVKLKIYFGEGIQKYDKAFLHRASISGLYHNILRSSYI